MKSKLLITIFLLLSLTVGIASAGEAFTNFTAYGDAWKSTNDTYTVIKWNATGARAAWNATGNVTSATTVEYAMVGGGGGGGKALGGGGGGAGAFWEGTTTGLTGAQTVAVGAYGARSTTNNTVGSPGAASTFASIVAIGGSGGGSAYISNVTVGGSAGGAGTRYNGGANNIWYTNVSNSTGHGNRGGFAVWNTTTNYAGGGGGGYARYGLNASAASVAGAGGKAGMTNISGTMYTLAGGGGGGTYSNTVGNRGLGGDNATSGITVGGHGGYRTTAATAPMVSTGSGGGGGGSTGAATDGSAGVIFIRWKTIPNSSFTANTTGGTTPIAVAFTDTSINGTATAWNWSFNNVTGNNTKVWWSTTQNPSITFGAGNWSILLNASSDGGYNWSSQTTFVNVSAASVPVPPVASFTANVSSGTDPTDVAFTDTSTNIPTGWNWAANNVTGNNTWFAFNTTNQNPVQRFGVGNWSINLTATNADGSDVSDQVTFVNVSAVVVTPPVASFTANRTYGTAPIAVGFTDTSANTPTNWDWYFGNGTKFSDAQNPSLLLAAGTYTINLYTSNAGGASWKNQTSLLYAGTGTVGAVTVNASFGRTFTYDPDSDWATLRSATAGTWYYPNYSESALITKNATVHWSARYVGVTTFNTSDIPDTATIGIANFTGYVWSNGGDFGVNSRYALIDFTPSSYTAPDYDTDIGKTTFTRQSEDTYFNDYATQNSTIVMSMINLTTISKTGYTGYMFDTNYTIDNQEYYPGAGMSMFTGVWSPAWDSGSKSPRLTIVYDLPSSTPPVASFTLSKPVLRIPQILTATDTSTNTPTSWEWSWGDGTANSTTQNPTHVYTKRGKFTIYLTATNAGGSDSSDASSVRMVGYENYY